MRLEARGVAYQYGNGSPRILEDFDFEMEHTERVGIMAPSGYGKTTLCKLLSGYLKPERGQVLLDGRPLSQENGYCPVQMIWQQPEMAVNPRMRMKSLEGTGDRRRLDEPVSHRVIRRRIAAILHSQGAGEKDKVFTGR